MTDTRKKVEVKYHPINGEKKIVFTLLDNFEVLTPDEAKEVIRDIEYAIAMSEDS